MAFLRYRGCGHLQFVGPPRTLHTTDRSGLCRRCSEKAHRSIVVVDVRRRLFAPVRDEQRVIHLLAREIMRK